jgi:hypothetical protein
MLVEERSAEEANVARSSPAPRKQRTRQHVIADQSINYVERFVLDEGHTVQRLTQDYGYDLMLFSYDAEGFAEPGVALLQLKASEALKQSGDNYVFDLDVRDYNLWKVETAPVFLILFDATRRRAYWLHLQHYFRSDSARQPKKGAQTVRVSVPKRQVISRRGVARMREIKRTIALQIAAESET